MNPEIPKRMRYAGCNYKLLARLE